jgi:hypothetical protein
MGPRRVQRSRDEAQNSSVRRVNTSRPRNAVKGYCLKGARPRDHGPDPHGMAENGTRTGEWETRVRGSAFAFDGQTGVGWVSLIARRALGSLAADITSSRWVGGLGLGGLKMVKTAEEVCACTGRMEKGKTTVQSRGVSQKKGKLRAQAHFPRFRPCQTLVQHVGGAGWVDQLCGFQKRSCRPHQRCSQG